MLALVLVVGAGIGAGAAVIDGVEVFPLSLLVFGILGNAFRIGSLLVPFILGSGTSSWWPELEVGEARCVEA